jgi:selenocysteine lyase/cysteine desulfurase
LNININDIRKEFPILQESIYLNVGTVGISPRSVVDQTLKSIEFFETRGQLGWGESAERMNESRKRMAHLLGASPEEIAFTRNATDGTNLTINGIDWREGDEVLLSDHEHPSMLFPWTYLQQRGYITLKRFAISPHPDETLANVRAAMTPKTRLLATSHVTSQHGVRTPVREIATLCREHGILTHIDGAQATGQFPIQVNELGCDFYTGNIHKWLLGPKGTGFYYVRQEQLEQVRPTWVGAGTGHFSEKEGLTPSAQASKFEYGTLDFGKYAAISAILDWFEGLGWDNVEAYMRELSGYLKAELEKIPHVTLYTPHPWEFSSAMTTFSVADVPCHEVSRRLAESDKMLVRLVGEYDALRISTAVFNTREEVDLLLKRIREWGGHVSNFR